LIADSSCADMGEILGQGALKVWDLQPFQND
jgi:hypothetical protein